MSNQAELNSLVIANLADLEAATRQAEEVTEMVQDELLRLVTEFVEAHDDWAGETDDLKTLWFAPRRWRDPAGGDDEYLAYLELRLSTLSRDAADAFWLSALTGVGSGKIGLYLVSDRLGDARLGKLFAADAELVQQLQAKGFVYDIADKRALYLPVALDREQLVVDLRDDSLDAAMEPIVRALDAAAASAALLDPLVARIGKAVDAR